LNQQQMTNETGCPVVSSTSAHEHNSDNVELREAGNTVRQHDNIGSIITMLIADQSVDLEDILTDSGIQRQEEMVQVQNQTSLQETTIKEEAEGLGIEYTNYSPDYSLYQRDYVATGETEPVETGRSRSLSSLSSCSDGDEEAHAFRTNGTVYPTDATGARTVMYSAPQYRGQGVPTKQAEKKDDKYWERRRKNNLAAKKSRDARRVRENQLRLRVLCLENANRVLREQMDRKHLESVQLRERLSKYESVEECTDRNPTPPQM